MPEIQTLNAIVVYDGGSLVDIVKSKGIAVEYTPYCSDALKMMLEKKYDLGIIGIELKDGPAGNRYGEEVAEALKQSNHDAIIIGYCNINIGENDLCWDCAPKWREFNESKKFNIPLTSGETLNPTLDSLLANYKK